VADTTSVDLPENLTITNVETLHELLEPYIQSSNDIILAAGDVNRVDTAGLQTLYAFSRSLHSRGIGLKWSSPSKELMTAAEQLGLKTLMALG
jgi:anti-anti-sigma regulatory factor